MDDLLLFLCFFVRDFVILWREGGGWLKIGAERSSGVKSVSRFILIKLPGLSIPYNRLRDRKLLRLRNSRYSVLFYRIRGTQNTDILQWRPLFTRTQYGYWYVLYGDCHQTRFLSSLGSHKFFYRRNKHENNYKVDYQRLKDFKLRYHLCQVYKYEVTGLSVVARLKLSPLNCLFPISFAHFGLIV